MEPVTKEFVEHADDFISHLSDNQLKERIAELKKKQYSLHTILIMEADKYKEPKKKDIIWRTGFTMLMCFESYKIKIPMISMITVTDIVKNDQKKRKHITAENDDGTNIQKSVDEIGQPNLFSFIQEKFTDDEEFHELFSEEDAHSLYFMLMLLGNVYATTLLRYS